MSRRQPADESLLFDLPLDRRPEDRAAAAAPEPGAPAEPDQPPLPLAVDETAAEEAAPAAAAADDETPPEEAEPARRRRRRVRRSSDAALRQRALGGLTDLGVCAAVLVVLLVALLAQGLRPGAADWPAGLLFLLTFSFLYSVLPLAFWGRTPGMTLAGLKATGRDGRPMTFRQAMLRWLGSVLTVALAGLPLLLAAGGQRSLSDLLGGTRTARTDPDG